MQEFTIENTEEQNVSFIKSSVTSVVNYRQYDAIKKEA